MNYLLLTVRFLDDRYHGLLDRGGPPEWPPSPFRLFCALVAGVARRGELETDIGKALAWLQALAPPIIIAPNAKTGQAITRFVPNNDGDEKPDRQERLTAKLTIPTLMVLEPDQKPEVHYLWDLRGLPDVPMDRIRDAARSLTTLGWGVDMAFADAKPVTEEDDVKKLKGVRWSPKPGLWKDQGMLRVPTADTDLQECTLCDLKHCHESAMARIEHGQPLHTVDKPRVFARVFYESEKKPLSRPFTAFRLLDPDTGKARSYSTTSALRGRGESGDAKEVKIPGCIRLAGMIRGVAGKLPRDARHDEAWFSEYVYGHHEGPDSFPRFSYLPLPSIQPVVGVGRISRVLIVEPISGDGREIAWLKRLLPDQTAINEQGLHANLEEIRGYDKVLSCYVGESHVWTTVTPVALPGSDDGLTSKTTKLFDKMLRHAGYSSDAVQHIEYHRIPFLRGAEDAKRYRPHGNHYLSNCTMYHVRIRWKFPMRGPIALGAGRHCGLGIFAVTSE